MDNVTKDETLLKAVEIAQKDYEKEEIFNILGKDDEFEKPLAILSLTDISNQNEADILIEHLTGCDGRIREVCAYKISEFLGKYCELFLNKKACDTILNGISDINPNVSRALIEGIKQAPRFQEIFSMELIKRAKEIVEKLKQFSNTPFLQNKLKDKSNHQKVKLVFNLYWALECIYYVDFEENFRGEIVEILSFCANYIDYTIREKSARILSKMENPPNELLQKLKNDENFYVKNQLL